MRTKSLLGRTALTVALLALVPFAQALTVIPPQIAELSGNWLGQSDNGELARLQLSKAGRGFLALNYYPNQPVLIYRVEIRKPKNSPLGYGLEFKVTPIGGSRHIQLIDGIGFPDKIKFRIAGDPFHSTYALTPEIEALGRIKKIISTPAPR